MYQQYIQQPHTTQEWKMAYLDIFLTSRKVARANKHTCIAKYLNDQIDNLYSAFLHIIAMHEIRTKV